MSKLIENAKKLRDDVYLKADFATSGDLWAIRKTDDSVVELLQINDDTHIYINIADLPDLRDLFTETIDYIEGME